MATIDKCWACSSCGKFRNDEHCFCTSTDDFCLRQMIIDTLYTKARLTDKQKKDIKLIIPSDGLDTMVFQELNNYSKNIVDFVNNGRSMYIHSIITGNGKTTWALTLLKSYLKKIWKYKGANDCVALFIHTPTFLINLKHNISNPSEEFEGLLSDIRTAELVVWDEFFSKNFTSYECEQLLSFIDGRISAEKSNIYTSNVAMNADMVDKMGSRLYSRVINTSIDIPLNSCDKRDERRA